jgi:hypothetical protein
MQADRQSLALYGFVCGSQDMLALIFHDRIAACENGKRAQLREVGVSGIHPPPKLEKTVLRCLGKPRFEGLLARTIPGEAQSQVSCLEPSSEIF